MCGITACLKNNIAIQSIVSALVKLQNRGYDSAGMSIIANNTILVKKNVSSQNINAINTLIDDPLTKIDCCVAIGHTRWATHGAKIICNAHPHTDTDMRFSIVHNGIIENYDVLGKMLINDGYTFYGQTDSEIIAKYLAFLAKHNQNLFTLAKVMVGSWAILFLDRMNPNRIYFLKNGSPLLAGLSKNFDKIMFASELAGFDNDISHYITLDDGEYGYAEINDGLCSLETLKKYEPIIMPNLSISSSPAPFPHWTIKEINDQPNAIDVLLSNRFSYKGITDNGGNNNDDNEINSEQFNISFPELKKIEQNILNCDHFILLGCGTSYHAAQIGAKFIRTFGLKQTVNIIDGADFEETDIPLQRNVILILFSQSGETKDLCRALEIGKKHKLVTVGIINVENSLIAREVDAVLYLKAGREHAVASTKSFTNQVIMMLLLTLWINLSVTEKDNYGDNNIQFQYLTALKTLSNDMTNIIKQSEATIPKILHIFENQDNCFILGKHINEWIAKEASLKIKEISYIHCEGFSAAALKHGPFALLTKDIPVIIIAPNDKYYSKINNITSEIKSRFATVVHITNKLTDKLTNNEPDHVFYFETDSILFPLLSIIPCQILAYELSIKRNNNPDYPRNLAKVVTVE